MIDIYASLQEDHNEIRDFLAQLEKDPLDMKTLHKLQNEMLLHNQAEEKVFYYALKDKLGALGVVSDLGKKEHESADQLLATYINSTVNKDDQNTIFSLLKRSILEHIEKEEKEMFMLANNHITQAEAQEMHKKFKREKDNIKDETK
ncbi:hemerythrin HHE cation binding region [endosymbiont of Acanthamoeba sp. UWC8]|uniref:hemerythrin domain-containing protein n=1 Tax=endosymbiont of Acanthamoeba sp. UWC8 TaxID=86106 RepID=UPI0004D113DD|nr:hemerythrin domain-containing protein [endosymbiont of Acanthamoeba sp. UWC8]AIF80763.1 hemerythrin HHE cation binding region [endosymbiont of Acanthamoeba sp. UWC8]